MELQKLIDGLRNHRNGAAAYESVDEAIRVFEAMRDVDGEKVVNGMERFRADFKPFVGNSCDWERVDDVLALIRQQQERIVALEVELGKRDYNAAIEMQQYCERYEPTYNPEDGSM